MALDYTSNDPNRFQDVRNYSKAEITDALRVARQEAREARRPTVPAKPKPPILPMEKRDPDMWRALNEAKPTWQKDGMGVRGNNIQGHDEQRAVKYPNVTVTSLNSAATTAVPAAPKREVEGSGGGNVSNFSFRLEDASEDEFPKVRIMDGEVNHQVPAGMGTDEYVLDTYDGAYINLIITWDTSTMAITSLTFEANSLTPVSLYGTTYVNIGRTYVDLDDEGNVSNLTAVNHHCGDVNLEWVYGALNGVPAVLPVAIYGNWVGIPTGP